MITMVMVRMPASTVLVAIHFGDLGNQEELCVLSRLEEETGMLRKLILHTGRHRFGESKATKQFVYGQEHLFQGQPLVSYDQLCT